MADFGSIDAVDPVAWETLRRELGSSRWASLSLREAANHVGMRWGYIRGDDPVGSFLTLTWDELSQVRGFGRKKLRHLMAVLQSARASCLPQEDPVRTAVSEEDREKAVRANLQNLSIPLWSSVELLALPTRAKAFLRKSGARDLDGLAGVLCGMDQGSVVGPPGVGQCTMERLRSLSAALLNGSADRISSFLPLGPNGHGLSFTRAASRLFESFGSSEREMLHRRLGEMQTLREAARCLSRTRGRASQIDSSFLRGLERIMESFPEDRLRFWKAWERCEPITDLLEQDGSELSARTLPRTIERLCARSREGRAIIAARRRQFVAWRKELGTMPELCAEGVRVASFLRARGSPHLLVPFIDYLSRRKMLAVDRTTATVRGKQRRRRGVVHIADVVL